MFQAGDYVECPGGHRGTVSYVGVQMVSVKFDNTELIPPIMSYDPGHLVLLRRNGDTECECGDNVGTYEHFKFCPAYRSGYDDFD